MSGLEPFRKRLDEIDDEIIALLGERFKVCRDIAEHKRENDIPMMQPNRVQVVQERYVIGGALAGMPRGFAQSLFDLLIDATCRMEDEMIAAPQEARDLRVNR
jgi:4-amino-4-deoxychorismate mutase